MRYLVFYARVAELIAAQLVTNYGSAPGWAHQKALNLKKRMVGTRRLELLTLSDHPKPANEYHLKTGQREQRLGH